MQVCQRCRAPLPPDNEQCPVCGEFVSLRTTMVETAGPLAREILLTDAKPQKNFRGTIQEPPPRVLQAANHSPARLTQAEPTVAEVTPRILPSRRPPMPKLVIMDDGSKTLGEIVRIRRPEIVIGRNVGDILIEHDPNISAKHVTIVRHLIDGHYRWRLTDESSTSGTFIRVNKAALSSDKTLIIGSWHYHVEMPTNAIPVPAEQDLRATRDIFSTRFQPKSKMLVLVNAVTPSRRYELGNTGGTIGRGPQSTIVIADDNYLCPSHARIQKFDGRWFIQDLGSVNGLWIQVKGVWLDQDAEFQIGEQRIHFLMS